LLDKLTGKHKVGEFRKFPQLELHLQPLKKLSEYLIRISFRVLDALFPTKNNIVFSTRGAKGYADNSKVLFEYFLSQGIDNVYFFTKKKDVYNKIPKNGIYAYSLKAIRILLQSRILVFTHGSGDFFPFSPPKTKHRKFVNLFHAIAVKEVGHKGNPALIKESNEWDYFVVSSSFEADFIKQQYSLTNEQIVVLGQPRNDILCKENSKPSEAKMVLYAPTFRDSSITELFPFTDKNLPALDDFLGRKGMKIMIRLHINEEKNYRHSKEYAQLENIFFAGSDVHPSVNDILYCFDALITDYSSIALDYLLLDKPIAYIAYDYEAYLTERGFSFDFHEHRAGPNISTQKDLQLFLDQKEDTFATRRSELKNLFHQYQNGKTSERLFNFIQTL